MKSINIFPWNENFNTGIQVIDAQHKKLVDILNRLASNVAFNAHLPALNEIFDELADYAVYHFHTEEAIWHEHLGSDPAEAAHKRVHEEFIETVTRLRHEESSKSKDKLVEETLAFLTRWLAAHILENDRYMALTALAVQSGMPLDAAKAHATQQMQGSTRSLIDIILSIYDSLSTNTLQLLREIADHKRDQVELSKLKLAVEQSPNAIMITDLNERIEYVNDAFLRISGFSRDQILGANPRLMGKGKTPAATIADMKSALARGDSWKGEFINCRKDNGEDYIESTWISPIRQPDGSITHYLAIKEDITESKRAEDQLQKLIREQKAILESDLIGIAKARGRLITWCNSTFEKLLGYQAGELTGKTTRAIYPSQLAYEALGAAAYPVIKAGNVYSTEIEFARKDGSYIWMELTGTMLDPATEETIWSFADISDRKQAEDNLRNSNSLLRTIIDSSPVRVFWKDLESRYLGCNHLFAHDAGFAAPEELTGKTDYDMGWKDQAELYRADDKSVMDSGEPKLFFDEPQTTPDGKRIWLRTSKVPLRHAANGEVYGLLGIYEDITEQREAQQAISDAKDMAERIAKTRSEFLANMSHEIRTPMNGIIGLSKLALNKDLPADVRDYVEKINSSSESLLGILNDILDVSKLEAGKFSIDHQHFSLSLLLRDLRGMFNHKAVEKGLAFEFEIAENTPDALIGDALRLQQVLANLTGNALKFTERGKVSITVAPKAVEGSAAWLTFSVSDTGIGISEADQQKLFQPFSQVDSSASRRFGGTGLGLAISKQLLELMGSQLNVMSHPGRGATFSFDLPVTLASDRLHHITNRAGTGSLSHDLREQGQALSGARILVAEDNKINQQVVKEFLKLSGIQVDIANDGVEALELLGRHPYDAVLMDLHMPVMDGIEATQRMRARPEYASLPIIALSAGVTREERDGCLAAGMNDFLPKPVNPEQMIATLIQWIPADVRATKSPARPGPEERWEEIAALLQAFDLRTLKVLIGGDSDLLKSMLEQFFQENAGESVVIMNKIRDGELAEAEALLHRFKGAAGNLGAMRLHSACQMLDSELKQGRYSKEALNDWLKVFDMTMSALSRALAKLQPTSPDS